MERLKRDPEKFEVIDLFTALSRKHSYKLKVDEDTEDFIKRIRVSLEASALTPNLIYGKRVESLFAHVAGALGNCKLIKQEDSGETFAVDQNIQPPDYRIILNDGKQYFIEVKNCHFPNAKSPYPLRNEYIEKLENYANLHGIPLLFAIYFSRHNKWFLLPKSSLVAQQNRHVTNLINAMAKTEMALLGDRTIATTPDLSIELIADKLKDKSIDESGHTKFIIGDVKLYCAGKEILEEDEKTLAFYLIRFGSWEEHDAEGIFADDEFAGVRFSYSPTFPSEDQEFSMIGALSSMISSAYNEQTIYERSVVALDTNLEPSVFSAKIPNEYTGVDLPLWQFTIYPNPEFMFN